MVIAIAQTMIGMKASGACPNKSQSEPQMIGMTNANPYPIANMLAAVLETSSALVKAGGKASVSPNKTDVEKPTTPDTSTVSTFSTKGRISVPRAVAQPKIVNGHT